MIQLDLKKKKFGRRQRLFVARALTVHAMSLTTEQQTSHLSRLQQEVLAWDYYRMGGPDDPGASKGRKLHEVPTTFGSINEYLDVFEPLVLEECAAQVTRGEEEVGNRPANIGAVFRSERINGFHVVHFILGEEAMSEFHDNDLILLSKTDPTVDEPMEEEKEGDGDGGTATAIKKTISEAEAAAAAVAAAAAAAEDAEGDDTAATAAATAAVGTTDATGKETAGTKVTDKDATRTREEGRREEDPNLLSRIYALGYVDGRDSRNRMRVRFYLPENTAKMSNNNKNTAASGAIVGVGGGDAAGSTEGQNQDGGGASRGRPTTKAAAKAASADAKRKSRLQQQQEEEAGC